MLVMVQVTQINLIINNNLRHSLGSVFLFYLGEGLVYKDFVL